MGCRGGPGDSSPAAVAAPAPACIGIVEASCSAGRPSGLWAGSVRRGGSHTAHLKLPPHSCVPAPAQVWPARGQAQRARPRPRPRHEGPQPPAAGRVRLSGAVRRPRQRTGRLRRPPAAHRAAAAAGRRAAGARSGPLWPHRPGRGGRGAAGHGLCVRGAPAGWRAGWRAGAAAGQATAACLRRAAAPQLVGSNRALARQRRLAHADASRAEPAGSRA